MSLDDFKTYEGMRVRLRMTVEASELTMDGFMRRRRFGSADEAARHYGISVHTVYRLIRDGGTTRDKVAFRAGKPTRKPRKVVNFEKRNETE